MSPLTARQRAALAVMGDAGTYSPTGLALLLGTSAEGAARSASSLVRRGLVERIRPYGTVHYRILASGLIALRHDQQELSPG